MPVSSALFVAALVLPPSATRLDVRIDPVADLALMTRHAAERDERVLPEEYEAALAPLRRLKARLAGSFLGFAPLDVALFEGGSAEDLLARLEKLPETARTSASGTASIREDAVEWGEALVRLEDDFLERLWPARRAVLEAARRDVEERFRPRESECFSAMLRALGLPDPEATIPVLLVLDAPWPGAMTYRGADGGGLCVVAASSHPGTLLFETLLHEATHALDLLAPKGEGVLEELRRRLQERGVSRTDPALRNVPHTLMFVQAAETIRREIDAAHVDYGEAAGYYAKVPDVAAVERRVWRAYLDGACSQEDAIEEIVERLALPADAEAPSRPAEGGETDGG